MTTRKYEIEGQRFEVEVVSRSGVEAIVRVNGKSYRVAFADQAVLSTPEVAVSAMTGSAARRFPPVAAVVGDIRAPMAGRILHVHARPGDHCAAGAPLIVLDAMKMENTLHAPRPGRVKEIAVRVGDTVLQDALLVRLD